MRADNRGNRGAIGRPVQWSGRGGRRGGLASGGAVVLRRVNGSTTCLGGRAQGLVNGTRLEDEETQGTRAWLVGFTETTGKSEVEVVGTKLLCLFDLPEWRWEASHQLYQQSHVLGYQPAQVLFKSESPEIIIY